MKFRAKVVALFLCIAAFAVAGASFADDFVKGQWIRDYAKQRGITLISAERAQEIARNKIKADNLVMTECDLDNEADDYPNGTDFRPVYQMEFRAGVVEFDIDVDAVSGEILRARRDD